MSEARFRDRTAVVTGAASGLGKDVCTRLTAEGARVVLWDVNRDALEAVAAELNAKHFFVVNVADPIAVQEAANATIEAVGSLELLVNSAGITGPTAPAVEYPLEEWHQVININLNGMFYCTRFLAPKILEGGYGRIVNVSSVGGKEGNPNASAYAASKAGVIGFTKALGKEVALSGVLVNAVTPAVFDSPLLAQMPQAQIDYMKAKIPMGRFGRIEETTALICFLLSDECSFSTGAVFDTSGGRSTY